ncbi:MAG: PaaI family thioesterase [Syntrophomonadaceae bacterium]
MDIDLNFLAQDRFAALVGVKLVQVEPGHAVAKLALEDKHLNAAQVVQGGAIFTLADFAFAAASNSHGRLSLAINASIDFFASPRGTVLTAEAKEVHRSPKLASYNVDIHDENGEICARFTGTVYRKKDRVEL